MDKFRLPECGRLRCKLRCNMVRKDKLHMTLLLCAAVLYVAANGSVAIGDDDPALHTASEQRTELVEPEAEQVEESQNITLSFDAGEGEKDFGMAPLYINGLPAGECIVRNGTALMSPGFFASVTGLDFDGITIGGITPVISEDGRLAVANGRYFYFPDGLFELAGERLWPLRELARLFGCSVSWNAASGSVDLDITELEPIEPGDDFYDEEELFWLARIIYSESGNQSLDGQIGVGNVVLNRVADDSFPDTIIEVIFDGQQFSPVVTGAIYCTPDEEAVLAARLALEGYNTVGDSLFFVNPYIGPGGWFAANLTYVTTIGDHVFYM